MKIEKTYTLNAPVDKVLELVRDPSVIEENEKSRDALEVKVEDVSSDESKHVFRVIATNHFRTKTGGVDKSKTEMNTVTNTWDLKSTSCSWNWEGTNPNASKVKLTGGNCLQADGDKTNMVLSAEVEVSIPIIGKTVSKKIAEGFAAEWPKYVEQLEARIKG